MRLARFMYGGSHVSRPGVEPVVLNPGGLCEMFRQVREPARLGEAARVGLLYAFV